MKTPVLALAAALAVTTVPDVARADLTFNVGAVSDYRYRGISQTRLKPAVQGGVDYAAGGFYVGGWASTIKWIEDAGGDAKVEIDVYAGYKGELTKSLSYDVGVLTYQYPGHKLGVSPNTTEIYGGLSLGPATLKISNSVTNLFGFADSKNSQYYDLSATFDLGNGFSLTPHIGRQVVRNNSASTYTDASLAVSKDFSGLVVSLTAVDARTGAYFGNGKDLGKRGVVLGAKYNF